MQQGTVIVVAGGSPPFTRVPGLPGGETKVIAADGGVDRALALGLRVDIAIGDFDSVTEVGLAAAEAAGATIERHPAAKDATDLELALDRAIALRPARIVVVASEGGRLDHLIASVLLLAHERYREAELDAYLGESLIQVVNGSRALAGAPGDPVSLLAVHGAAEGVTTEGLEYELRGETLAAGTSHGVSNVFTAASARITVEHGCLLAVRPAAERGETL